MFAELLLQKNSYYILRDYEMTILYISKEY